MTRGGTRSIAVLAATALVALLLAACGSSDSDSGSSDSSSSNGSATTEANPRSSGSQGGSQGQSGSQQQGGASNGGSQGGQQGGAKDGTTGFTAAEVETPLEVSGGGAEQFVVKGGDNSIQEFGEESGESELEEAAEAVHGFFVARATGDWESACGYLSKAMTEQLEQLAASSTSLEDRGCASFLQAFTSKLSASTWREVTTVDAGSLRLEGEQAFLIYYGPDKTVYAMPLAVEDGSFRVGALSGNPLG